MSNVTQSIDRLKNNVMHMQLIPGLSPNMNDILTTLMLIGVVMLISILSLHMFKRYLKRVSGKEKHRFSKCAKQHYLDQRIAYLLPIVIFYFGLEFIDKSFPQTHATLLIDAGKVTATSLILFISALTISSFLSAVEAYYKHFSLSQQFPIKSYIQVLKIICYILTGILIISVLLDKSPMYFITGIGALTAVILLVFRDSILGFVASIQLTAYDMVRLGDWIEITSFGANGTIIDISLNTIKVRNFDNTIVTVPSYSLLTNGVKNWRGMSESGGRRIMQSFPLDVSSIRFCDQVLFNNIKKLPHMAEVIEKKFDLGQMQTFLPENQVPVSNLTIFRLYLNIYLSNHPKIHQDMTLLVRELDNTGSGLPIGLYMFTNDVDWVNYENIKADILDHIYAMMPFFGLRPFQYGYEN